MSRNQGESLLDRSVDYDNYSAISPVSDEEPPKRKCCSNPLIAAFSNLSTAFNLVNISIAHVIMENQYCGGDNCPTAVSAASTAVLVGAIAGQLTFGYVGDCIGRSRALQLTMALSIFGALVSAFAVPLSSTDPSSVFTFLILSRLVLGVGVGGVYPLSATIAAESSGDQNRGRIVSLVFSMQGLGNLISPSLAFLFIRMFGTPAVRAAGGLPFPGISWRLLLGIGALPGLLLLPFKATPSKAATDASAARAKGKEGGKPPLSLLQALKIRRYWPKLVGTAGGWFLFDITFYGNSLFAPTVLKAVFHNDKNSTPVAGDSLSDNLCAQLMIIAAIGLPGYYISVWLMDSLGRKNIQLQGFSMMFIIFLGLAIFLDALDDVPALLLILYGLTFFFSNFGPNSTTFVLPAETFPVEVRSTFNGLSAAMGKVGAAIGSATFKPIVNSFGKKTNMGDKVAFYCCAGVALLGVIVTIFFVEDRRGKGMETSELDNKATTAGDDEA